MGPRTAQSAAATATRVVGNVYDGVLAARIIVSTSTGTDWHLQWKHTNLSIITDTAYIVRFAARADSVRRLTLSITKDVSPLHLVCGY